jgi:branched-chain amino acid transport system ATP-binding protein
MSYLEVDGLGKRFGGLQAVDDCSFHVEQGGTTCLIGPNGAGKTTIFNLITGFLRPDAGSVAFKGRDIGGCSSQELVGSGIARSFQNLRLFEEMSVLDNVMVGLPQLPDEGPLSCLATPFLPALRRRREAAVASAMAVLADVGLAGRAGTLCGNLSYGDQKLLCIGRVLASRPELLMLDEPASGLDADALENVVALLATLRGRGMTLVVIEHNAGLVRRIADQVLFLHQGRMVASGTPEEIMTKPELTEIYFGGGAVVHA